MRRTLLLAGAVIAAGIVAPVAADAGTAAPPGLQVVERTGIPTMGDIAEVVVPCPFGTKVYSAGGRVNGQLGQAVLHRVQPMPDLSRVVVSGRLRTAGPAWSVTGYAICAAGNPVLQTSIGIEGIMHIEDTVMCPAGTTVTGVGGELINATSEVSLMRLIPDLGANTATAAASGPGPAPGVTWDVKASAICAGGINGAVLKTFTTTLTNAPSQSASVKCDTMKLLGMGGGVVANAGNEPGALLELKATPDGKEVQTMGTAGATPWSMAAYAICVPAL